MAGIFRLKGVVKHYDWGGYSFIPHLLQVDNAAKKPFAEYWMGTHPLGNGTVEQEPVPVPLTAITAHLPYLFKILDVKDMLSIQVHPSKTAAELEFRRENEAGIPLDAPHRNYKDGNHKPEMTVALGDFWLLHGFKPGPDLEKTLQETDGLQPLLPVFQSGGYAALYRQVMEMPQAEVNRMLRPLVNRIVPLYEKGALEKSSADFWAARAALSFSKGDDIDRGIFSIYIFNVVHLKKGEGIFQDAGLPHAYLEGQNVELMANSDNVLRGGLTTKHIDVPELMKHVKFVATHPQILPGKEIKPGERLYETPAPDFELTRLAVQQGNRLTIQPGSTEIWVVVEGEAILEQEGKTVVIGVGHPSALVLPGKAVQVSTPGVATVYRASIPERP